MNLKHTVGCLQSTNSQMLTQNFELRFLPLGESSKNVLIKKSFLRPKFTYPASFDTLGANLARKKFQGIVPTYRQIRLMGI
jgi:hypothetical protein